MQINDLVVLLDIISTSLNVNWLLVYYLRACRNRPTQLGLGVCHCTILVQVVKGFPMNGHILSHHTYLVVGNYLLVIVQSGRDVQSFTPA